MLTKLLVLRLSVLLPHLICLTQSGFVPGWVLHDNVLWVQELVHDIKHRNKSGNMVLTLDVAKLMIRCPGPLFF